MALDSVGAVAGFDSEDEVLAVVSGDGFGAWLEGAATEAGRARGALPRPATDWILFSTIECKRADLSILM